MVPGIVGGLDSLMGGPVQHAVTVGSGEGVISVLELRKQQSVTQVEMQHGCASCLWYACGCLLSL
jgi:hypothetical protein